MTEPQSPPAASNAEVLLDTANSASQHVAVLHVAFMALCAYVLVIVFGTTDMNLLIGKGVKLPVMDVTVPIIGFYAFAPYLVVLVHFNLLLQLQLLSRQLYAFDVAVPKQEAIGGLRDRLHIFPYTYYLVGQPGPIVQRLLGFMVGTTLLILPLATLLGLQLRFIAYQDGAVTWAQRLAVWLDVALVIALWPVIMDRGDSWRDYLCPLVSRLRQRWRALWRRWRGRGRESEGAISTAPMGRGMPGLLLVVALGVPLPLGLLADGEWWEELLGANVVASVVYGPLRFLDLNEQVLLAKPAKPEVVAHLREGDPEEVEEALKQVERANLRERSLRRASFVKALLSRADLRGAQLQGANLQSAQLQRAELSGAQLQGADLWSAQLQDADLAQLQGASLGYANLQDANLGDAQLQGADLESAQLQGANLSGAQLQGANLSGAKLQGADLQSAELYGANVENSRTALVDLRAARWTPLNAERLGEIREVLGKTPYPEVLERIERAGGVLDRIERAGNAGIPPPILESCLIDPDVTPELNCEQKWLPTEVEAFRVVCAALLGERECEGLGSMPEADNRIRDLAR